MNVIVEAGANYVGVIGAGEGATGEQMVQARRVGELLARKGVRVVTGGLGGVMRAACEGAVGAGGVTLGLLPGSDRADGNQFLTVSVPTGLGEMRNALVVRSSEAIIAVGGSWGTLSEIALAVRTGVPVIALGGWPLPGVEVLVAQSPEEAVEAAVRTLAR
ncbi:TIGR00725 family protein [Speluncibacter jeojiensis]|uniref:TIGR00725 family protein n=1 Tax=Speluncibacter jeojiensis TaxID=2710754 RepID=A0A9X4LZN0_9ACTN|nr:TIGR00725 family protein [Rhodococcus sp. D2-41]MDG3015313.1 TIGR00725 family protein [Corynebacteriales bacterium D3-21]